MKGTMTKTQQEQVKFPAAIQDEKDATIKRLTAEVAELRDLIEECEWVAPRDTEYSGWCPWCGWESLLHKKQHKPNCRVAAAIKGETGKDYLAPADVRVAVKPLVDAVAEASRYLNIASVKAAAQYARQKRWTELTAPEQGGEQP